MRRTDTRMQPKPATKATKKQNSGSPTVLTRDGRRLARIVPEEDAWVYSPAWQDKLQQAEADLTAGRVHRFDSDEEFLGHLEAIDEEADG
jgi:hypothetical protein